MNDRKPWSVFLIFLRLGLSSFGGPVAHLGYFRAEFVTHRGWLSERGFADLVALCQFLPGPSSSQVGIALGLTRAGYAGALAAWLGFTLPSALVLVVCALGLSSYGNAVPPGALHGLQMAAVAIVIQAAWGMARVLCADTVRIAIMISAACVVLLMPSAWGQVGAIAVAGGAGMLLFKPTHRSTQDRLPVPLGRRTAAGWLTLFFVLLAVLPVIARLVPGPAASMISSFYRAGALVFGGGHVVLPLLQTAVVPNGWVSDGIFLAGYGITQAMPGPLFAFAAFLGASMSVQPAGWAGAALCLFAIFAPSFLLMFGCLPFWEQLRRNMRMQAALSGINAAVVGLLLAALYDSAWKDAMHGPQDVALALAALTSLLLWKLPPWLVVVASATAGCLLNQHLFV